MNAENSKIKFMEGNYIFYCDGNYETVKKSNPMARNLCRAIAWDEDFYIDYWFEAHLSGYHKDIKRKLAGKLKEYRKAGEDLWQ